MSPVTFHGVGVGGIWLAIASPVFVTGSDPTRIPLGAILGPIGATFVTALASIVANVMRTGDEG